MKRIIFILLFFSGVLQANDTELILNEIKLLREDMNKRFEQADKKIDQVNERITQMDIRIGQVEKRINFVENLMLVLIGGILASPFLVEYMARRREEVDRKTIEDFRRVIIVLRELASRDENVSRALKIAGIE